VTDPIESALAEIKFGADGRGPAIALPPTPARFEGG
jgi:hypothetical protein